MKYATMMDGKVNLIVCDDKFANEHSDMVIQVPDNVHTGWVKLDDGSYVKPVKEVSQNIQRADFIHRFTTDELVAIYDAAKTDSRIAVFKELTLSLNTLNRKKVEIDLGYLVNKNIITEQRKGEILA